ncbi:MAG: DUF5620 domain-containing protein [Oscillospiraceae bacterium]|nr:DUF5620 domain-containing protein [Oscillospiraceae bacterium]
MRTATKLRRFISAAVCAAITATMAAFPTSTAYAVNVNQKLPVDSTYTGYTADYGTSVESLTIYVTSSAAGTMSYGFGIGTAASPYWIEMNNGTLVEGEGEGTSVKLPASTSTPIKIDLSKFKLSYSPKTDQYPGRFEFRNYYSDGTITIDKIVANESGSSSGGGSGSQTSENTKSGSYTFKDNKDGTATISTTLSGTLDDIDAVLTRGYDEDTYYDPETGKSTWTESDPINSRKLKYKDFGIAAPAADEKITLESFTFSVSSEVNMDTFMYGCGLNVVYMSPADSEYWIEQQKSSPDTHKGYWYNEHGADADGEYDFDRDALEIVPTEGTTLEDCGKWVDAVWDVPAEIQEYATVKDGDAISFQFWYGANKENGYEEYDEVELKSATCTYTLEKTVPYTGSAAYSGSAISLTQGDDTTNSASVSMKEFSLTANDTPVAVKFKLSIPSEIKKLVFGVGVSDTNSANQYSDFQYAVLNAATDQEIMWIIPSNVAPDVLYGNLTFGYYYGADSSDKLVNTIKLTDVTVYYATTEVTTTTTTSTSTTTTTTTTSTTKDPTVDAVWGDADCNGSVDVLDAVLLARVAAEDTKTGITDQGKINSDVTHDNTVKNDDLSLLLKYLANLIPYEDLCP